MRILVRGLRTVGVPRRGGASRLQTRGHLATVLAVALVGTARLDRSVQRSELARVDEARTVVGTRARGHTVGSRRDQGRGGPQRLAVGHYQDVRNLRLHSCAQCQVFPFDKNTHWPETVDGRSMDTYHRWMETVVPWTMAGVPVAGMPVGFDDRSLPMGIQIIGRHGADLDVLQLAYAFEQATQWSSGFFRPHSA